MFLYVHGCFSEMNYQILKIENTRFWDSSSDFNNSLNSVKDGLCEDEDISLSSARP